MPWTGRPCEDCVPGAMKKDNHSGDEHSATGIL
jgi:hypothetical protein